MPLAVRPAGLVLVTWVCMFAPPQSEFVISYRIPAAITMHEPVRLDMAITNKQSQEALVELGWNREGHFALRLNRPDGQTVTVVPQPEGTGGISQGGRVSVQSTHQYSQSLLLNKWFSFDQVGEYTLVIDFTGTARSTDGMMLNVDADRVLTFRVLPRNEEVLRRTADHLLEQVISGPSYTVAAEAATALAYMGDPILADYMGKAISGNPQVESIAIKGLERLGTDAAAEVLEQQVRSGRPETAELALAALERLRTRRR
jgi:hypothetical protein